MPQGPAAAEHRRLTLRAARDVCCAQCQVKSQIKLWHHKEYHMKRKGPEPASLLLLMLVLPMQACRTRLLSQA